jgi:hypothetical protein
MAAAKPLARYSAVEGALASGLLQPSYTTKTDTNYPLIFPIRHNSSS